MKMPLPKRKSVKPQPIRHRNPNADPILRFKEFPALVERIKASCDPDITLDQFHRKFGLSNNELAIVNMFHKKIANPYDFSSDSALRELNFLVAGLRREIVNGVPQNRAPVLLFKVQKQMLIDFLRHLRPYTNLWGFCLLDAPTSLTDAIKPFLVAEDRGATKIMLNSLPHLLTHVLTRFSNGRVIGELRGICLRLDDTIVSGRVGYLIDDSDYRIRILVHKEFRTRESFRKLFDQKSGPKRNPSSLRVTSSNRTKPQSFPHENPPPGYVVRYGWLPEDRRRSKDTVHRVLNCQLSVAKRFADGIKAHRGKARLRARSAHDGYDGPEYGSFDNVYN